MSIDGLFDGLGAWLSAGGDDEVVISTRIRLARNVGGVAFPGWAGREEMRRVGERVLEAIRGLDVMRDAPCLAMGEVESLDRMVLQERRLISAQFARAGEGSRLVFRPDETLSIMINEEDHLRLQSMRPGFALRESWQQLDELDSELEHRVDYAFDEDLGYLTACPSNVGTGIRASVMLHLPGLRLTGEVEPVIKGLGKIGLAVRGSLGEGTDVWGNMFQVSNQMTLGESEEEIVERIEQIVLELVEHESNARDRLMESRPHRVRDHVGRAYGMLQYAEMLTTQEALDLLSALRLGIDLGLVHGLHATDVNRLILLTQPGHLQTIVRESLSPDARDMRRALFIRQNLAETSLGDTQKK